MSCWTPKRFASTLAPLRSNALKITKTSTPKPLIPNKELVFGRAFTDHMLTIEHDQTEGWHAPQIRPYANLSLDPSSTVFHYAVECFEGMKAYKDAQNRIRLFRPDMNMNRLYRSCARLTLPLFDRAALLECIQRLLLLDQRWIPAERGYSLYIRPTVIATQPSLGVGQSAKSMLFVICSPVGPYYKTGFAAISLLADPKNIRAWPGGCGDYKVGGNYAPGILAQIHAAAGGFQQNLWLFPQHTKQGTVEHMLTEVGTMNLFLFWKNEQGELELVTPPLDGTILPGVTRDCILQLTRGWNQFKVSERAVSMRQLVEASDQGRIVEMFGSGTAAIVSPIKNIRYVTQRNAEGVETAYKDLNIPLDPKNPQSQAGPLTQKLSDLIMGIQYGEAGDHPWSVVVKP